MRPLIFVPLLWLAGTACADDVLTVQARLCLVAQPASGLAPDDLCKSFRNGVRYARQFCRAGFADSAEIPGTGTRNPLEESYYTLPRGTIEFSNEMAAANPDLGALLSKGARVLVLPPDAGPHRELAPNPIFVPRDQLEQLR